jgi:SpoIID/LytB domain protein
LSLFVCAFALASSANAQTDRVIINGVGTAHGLGMAMDGVEGEARAGWSHDRILDLFYPGTSAGHAGGTIRVGLGRGSVQHFVLPSGGSVLSGGVTKRIAPGKRVTIVLSDGRPVLRTEPAAEHSEGSEPASSGPEPVPGIGVSAPDDALTPPQTSSAPTSPPDEGAPTPPPAIASPLPPATDEPTPTTPPHTRRKERHTDETAAAVRIVPHARPALVTVEATGRRYRGRIDVIANGGTLQVVNVVDLESYIAGIAEERGAGWPVEGLKALAVAARSLAAASRTWLGTTHSKGYDICPTQNCQVYLGYDGEEAAMRRAAAETAGVIRTYHSRPILAMYHGNGGGLTESYQKLARTKTSSHPYLRSVKYPYASPSTWRRDTTYSEIHAQLAAAGISAPSPITRIEILERGDSPRVVLMRLHGTGNGYRDMTGTTFMNALDLWSTWFEIGERRRLTAVTPSRLPPWGLTDNVPVDQRGPGLLVSLTAAFAALAVAGGLQLTAGRLPLALRLPWSRPRPADALSRNGS